MSRASWQYAPRPRLATLMIFAGWVAFAFPFLFVFGVLVFAGPWDPDDLTAQDWLAQADRYRGIRALALGVLAAVAALVLVATVGALLRRWAAPLVFAIGMCPALILLIVIATFGMEQEIDAALEESRRPPVPAPLPPPSPPTFTTEEVTDAVHDGVDRSLRAAVGSVVTEDGRRVTSPDEVPVTMVPCAAGGSSLMVDLRMVTADNVETERAILDAWVTDGYTRDRALGLNLLYGAEADPIERATLRGNSDGLLRLTIQSRCATG